MFRREWRCIVSLGFVAWNCFDDLLLFYLVLWIDISLFSACFIFYFVTDFVVTFFCPLCFCSFLDISDVSSLNWFFFLTLDSFGRLILSFLLLSFCWCQPLLLVSAESSQIPRVLREEYRRRNKTRVRDETKKIKDESREDLKDMPKKEKLSEKLDRLWTNTGL